MSDLSAGGGAGRRKAHAAAGQNRQYAEWATIRDRIGTLIGAAEAASHIW